MTQKRFKFLWVRVAYNLLREAGVHYACAGFAVLFAVAAQWATAFYWGVGFMGLLYVIAWVAGILVARNLELKNQLKFLKQWVSAAPSANEVAKRQELWNRQGTDAALVAAGGAAMAASLFAPAINIDGTPMVDGTPFDLNGNVYGATPMGDADWNQDTGVHVAPLNSYADPIGMNASNM